MARDPFFHFSETTENLSEPLDLHWQINLEKQQNESEL